MAATSKILFDSITESVLTGGGTITFNHNVNSSDAILVIAVRHNNNAQNSTASFNGVNIPRVIGANQANAGSEIFIMWNPPVGSYAVTVVQNVAGGGVVVCAMTILGVDKKTTNPLTASTTTSSSLASVSMTVPVAAANSVIIDSVYWPSSSPTGNPIASEQTQIQNDLDGNGDVGGVSYTIASSSRLIGWTFSINAGSSAYCAVVLEPAQAPSQWFPNIDNRTINDVIGANNLNSGPTPQSNVTGTSFFRGKQTQFYLNSFLHTIGRLLGPPPSSQATVVAETERPTSQIIIDKVFQGEVAAVALSTVNLNLQIDVPSADAVLVVTGGSVIATGAPWASVALDGQPLTKLIQAGVANQSAEIWFLPYPPVGSHTLAIASGTGGEIYANAMVILGVDKRSTNITVASITDAAATSTITLPITPDAPNSLIIDSLSTLNATNFPVPNSSQNQVFNATALATSEYVLSSFKIGNTSGENMNYNLSVVANASLVAAAFRPAQAASMWFPNIDTRELNDVVETAGLDEGTNPASGNYGYKPSVFYQNSFLHTVGRANRGNNPVVVNTGAPLLLMGVG